MTAASAPPALAWRLVQLILGFVLWGLGVALLVRAGLGLSPWDVFHQGFSRHSILTIGQAGLVTGAFLLLFWIPLRMRPGVGTLLNVLTIGPSADLFLLFLPPVDSLPLRWGCLLAALLLTGIASALYLPARLGAGPRDGLMLGLYRRLGWSIRLSRSLVELTALAAGFALGGTVGIGTVVMALGLGPVVQLLLGLRRRLFGLEQDL